MRLLKIFASVTALAAMVGCATGGFPAPGYAPDTDNLIALRTLKGQPVRLGTFTATKADEREIMCRRAGPIKTSNGTPFSAYIRNALVLELSAAQAYSPTAQIELTGNLDAFDFSTATGNWDIALTLRSSNGRSVTAVEKYGFPTPWHADVACHMAAVALRPAVQKLISKVVTSPDFAALLK